jgi:hypothetical protein
MELWVFVSIDFIVIRTMALEAAFQAKRDQREGRSKRDAVIAALAEWLTGPDSSLDAAVDRECKMALSMLMPDVQDAVDRIAKVYPEWGDRDLRVSLHLAVVLACFDKLLDDLPTDAIPATKETATKQPRSRARSGPVVNALGASSPAGGRRLRTRSSH